MNERKFSGKADLYERFRPSYPKELIDFLYENTENKTVADIGAGTGKFTRCLLKKPWKITAVEPNADMRERLEKIGGITVVNASAEDTGLSGHTFGLVTAAQAFHWFDEDKFRYECKRILTKNGRLAIVWNSFVNEGLALAQRELCKRLCPEFKNGKTGKRSSEEGDRFLCSEYFSELEVAEYKSERIFDRESFIGESLSRSYAPKVGQPNYERFVEELNKVFSEFESGGKAAVACKTTLYFGRF